MRTESRKTSTGQHAGVVKLVPTNIQPSQMLLQRTCSTEAKAPKQLKAKMTAMVFGGVTSELEKQNGPPRCYVDLYCSYAS